MDVDVATTTAQLHALREEWEGLEQRDPHCSYYSTHRFVSAWWDAFSEKPGVDLFVVAVRNNHRLVGIAPLSIRREPRKGGGHQRLLRFAGHGDYLGLVLDPAENADSICKKLLGFLDSAAAWDTVALTNIPASSPFSAFLLKSDRNPSFTLHIENPYLDLTEYADFEDFAAKRLPSKVRKYRNKLFRERDVKFRVVRGDADGIFDRIAALHQEEKRFLVEQKARGERHSLYEDPFRAEHIKNVFTRTEDPVTFVYENGEGELLGYRTCFLHRRTLLSWNSAYHPDYDPYRIGKVIQYDIVQHLYDEGLADVFDFGAGRYPWKFEWTDRFTATYKLHQRLPRKPDGEERPPRQEPEPARALSQPETAKRGLSQVASSLRDTLLPPVIWYVPHPDDETIFMGASIAQNRRRRNIVVLLSRGGASKAIDRVNANLPGRLSRGEFMRARMREFRVAVRSLGVDLSDVLVHDLPDGGLEVSDVYDVVRAMAARHPRAAHRTLSYLDPHSDHRNAGLAVQQAYDDGVIGDCTFHVPIPKLGDDVGEPVQLRPAAIEAKRAALREYEVWNPQRRRYAVGAHSVGPFLTRQHRRPAERVHGPGYRP
jgi:LmbE family N-acetylglucosaminyl deacetylase/CelD/BcsL family acetyltransferase involved in cellulose biosynthesis